MYRARAIEVIKELDRLEDRHEDTCATIEREIARASRSKDSVRARSKRSRRRPVQARRRRQADARREVRSASPPRRLTKAEDVRQPPRRLTTRVKTDARDRDDEASTPEDDRVKTQPRRRRREAHPRLVLVPSPPRRAAAQIAAAIGRPLPSPDSAGTVSVRVVAGSPSKPGRRAPRSRWSSTARRASRAPTRPAARSSRICRPARACRRRSSTRTRRRPRRRVPAAGDSGVRLMLTTRPWNPGAAACRRCGRRGGAMPESAST